MNPTETSGAVIDPKIKAELSLTPVEQRAPVRKKGKSLRIGIPCENSAYERRIPLKPDAVAVLTRNGHQVMVQSNAGKSANFTDREYSDAGAQIAYSEKEVLDNQIVLKVEPPTPDEMEMIPQGSTLISALKFATLKSDYLKALSKRKITAIAYELMEDKVGTIPIMRSMSEIAGSAVMLIAAEYLSSYSGGKGIILGGITGVPPTKVVILGAGTVAEYAARTAIGLGAEIKIFDNHVYKLRRLKYAIGHEVYTSTFDETTLHEAITRADVVIGAVRAEKGRSPVVVTEEVVAAMKPNSVIIDVSIDQGGCFETSEMTTIQNPIFKKYEVIHYCVPNIASRVANTSSTALSHIFLPYLLDVGNAGGIEEIMYAKKWFSRGVYAHKGSITNLDIAHKYNLAYKDLNLLLTARW